MKIKRFPFLSLCVMALAAMSMVAISAPSGPASLKDVTVTVVNGRDLVHARSSGTNLALHSTRLSLTSHAPPAISTAVHRGIRYVASGGPSASRALTLPKPTPSFTVPDNPPARRVR